MAMCYDSCDLLGLRTVHTNLQRPSRDAGEPSKYHAAPPLQRHAVVKNHVKLLRHFECGIFIAGLQLSRTNDAHSHRTTLTSIDNAPPPNFFSRQEWPMGTFKMFSLKWSRPVKEEEEEEDGAH